MQIVAVDADGEYPNEVFRKLGLQSEGGSLPSFSPPLLCSTSFHLLPSPSISNLLFFLISEVSEYAFRSVVYRVTAFFYKHNSAETRECI